MHGNRFDQSGQDGFAPVRVGEELSVTIEAVGEKGDGIAKKSGFVLFVPNVKAGDRVKIKVSKVLKKVGFAEIVEKLGKGDIRPAAPVMRKEEPKEHVEEIEISEEDMKNDSEDFGEDEDFDEDDDEERKE